MNSERRQFIERFLIDCCEKSAILYNEQYKSIKYLVEFGKVIFFENSRMIDYIELSIPDYDKENDEIIMRDIFYNSSKLKCCESHSYKDCHYVYTIMLNKNS